MKSKDDKSEDGSDQERKSKLLSIRGMNQEPLHCGAGVISFLLSGFLSLPLPPYSVALPLPSFLRIFCAFLRFAVFKRFTCAGFELIWCPGAPLLI
jgi:hypothetical protein